jgi:ketosteroid isomerase-like protein
MAPAVSPEALEQWKRLYECWNSGDFDEMLDMYAEDATFDVSAVFTDLPPVRGHADIRNCWDELYETLDGLRMDPIEVFSLGSGRYVADMRLWGRGRRSGAEVDRRYGYLAVFGGENGKCLHSQLLPDMASAFAVGKEPASPLADST